MSETLDQHRRSIAGATLATIAAGTFAVAPIAAPVSAQTHSVADHTIRPFRVNVPDEALVDLRKRVLATRWPEKETVGDRSQGVQLVKLQELVRYWGTDYDWRKIEAKLNALPPPSPPPRAGIPIASREPGLSS